MTWRFFDIRGSISRYPRLVLGVVPGLVLLGAWWFCTSGAVEDRIINVSILPSPAEVVQQFFALLASEKKRMDLLHHTWTSLWRVLQGFFLALAITLPLGIASGAFAAVRAMTAPMMTVSGYIPIAALVPLTMSWFGTGESQKIYFLAIAFAIFLMPQILKAIDNVDDIYVRTARTLGAGRLQLIFRVLIPVAAPDLWHAIRLAFGVGWTYIVLTEAIVLNDGLGFVIQIAQRRGPREDVYITILLIMLIAWLADWTMARIGEKMFPYRAEVRR